LLHNQIHPVWISSRKDVKTLIFSISVVPKRSYGNKNFRPATMNDLPTPQGDFFFLHAKRERTHNAVLAFGTILFASTLYFVSLNDRS
jgi:hypothetical protein